MKITKIDIGPLDLELQHALTVAYGSYPVLNYALIKVHTDNGLVGLGEASPDPEVTGETQEAVITALEQVRDSLTGRDPFDVEALINLCLDRIPEYPSAIAAVDMALYDLMGKHLDVPIYGLLGGKTWPGIRLYPVIPMESAEAMAEMSRQFVGMGAQVLKIKLGSTPEEDLARMQAIRQVAGDEIRLRLDINQGWGDAETAIEMIQLMPDYNIDWVEQPVAAEDIYGLAEVTDVVDVPIMADESCLDPEDVLEIVCEGAADMINIKLMKCGGIFQASKMLAIAEAAGVPCILGSMGESSIGSSAGLLFSIAHRGIIACEAIGPLFIKNDPAEGFEVDLQSFLATPPDRPGLGVKLR